MHTLTHCGTYSLPTRTITVYAVHRTPITTTTLADQWHVLLGPAHDLPHNQRTLEALASNTLNGVALCDSDSIIVNADLPRDRLATVLAHELGHCIAHDLDGQHGEMHASIYGALLRRDPSLIALADNITAARSTASALKEGDPA